MLFMAAVAETSQSPGVEGIINTFGLNMYDLLSQAGCFIILAFILNRFVFKPVLKIVDQKRLEAKEAAENAEKIKNELRQLEEGRAEIIRKSHEHAKKMLSEAKAEMAVFREQEKIRTEQLGVQILEKAREEAVLDRKKIRSELKEEIAGMIVGLTAIVTEKNIEGKDRERIMDSALDVIASEEKEQK